MKNFIRLLFPLDKNDIKLKTNGDTECSPQEVRLLQGRVDTFGGAGAQSLKGGHGTWLLIGL